MVVYRGKDLAELSEQYTAGGTRETGRAVHERGVRVRAWGWVHLVDSRKAVPGPEAARGLLSSVLPY